jgi:hypothetical protein
MRGRSFAPPGAALYALALLAATGLGSGCAVYSEPQKGLCRERSIESRPFTESQVFAQDLEDIAFENGTDLLWVGDDSANQLYIVDSETGRFRARLRERDFLAAFPEARLCDNGSVEVDCSYTAELESVAYDPDRMTLFVLNTVNSLKVRPAIDKPALYKLAKLDEDSNLLFVDWRPMPEGYKYGVIVVIDGTLYVAIGSRLYEFDFDRNTFPQLDQERRPVAAYSARGGIVGLAHAGPYLWILTQDMKLAMVDWAQKEERSVYDLQPLGFSKVKGLAYGRSSFFVVEGDAPNPVQVLRFGEVQGLTRATYLGGWPRSCP